MFMQKIDLNIINIIWYNKNVFERMQFIRSAKF